MLLQEWHDECDTTIWQGGDVSKRRLLLQLLGKPILLIQLSPVHVLCPLLLFQMLLVNDLPVTQVP